MKKYIILIGIQSKNHLLMNYLWKVEQLILGYYIDNHKKHNSSLKKMIYKKKLM